MGKLGKKYMYVYVYKRMIMPSQIGAVAVLGWGQGAQAPKSCPALPHTNFQGNYGT